MMRLISTVTVVSGFLLAGCSTVPNFPAMPASPISTSALPAAAKPAVKSATPVRTSKATQMYVWAGFKEKDCSPITPTLGVSQPPTKGTVTFRENETITVQHSASGKCIGQSMAGTGIYYQPTKGQDGGDSFTVTASTASGQAVTRTFNVKIVE